MSSFVDCTTLANKIMVSNVFGNGEQDTNYLGVKQVDINVNNTSKPKSPLATKLKLMAAHLSPNISTANHYHCWLKKSYWIRGDVVPKVDTNTFYKIWNIFAYKGVKIPFI